MGKRKKPERVDGFGPTERKRIDSAIRRVWYQSRARATAVKRCTDKSGFTRCQKCKARTPKLKIDHITPAGPVDSDGFIVRLFCPSTGLQGLCPDCHQLKTNRERVVGDPPKRKRASFLDSFGLAK